jgi:hypothetical protein
MIGKDKSVVLFINWLADIYDTKNREQFLICRQIELIELIKTQV